MQNAVICSRVGLFGSNPAGGLPPWALIVAPTRLLVRAANVTSSFSIHASKTFGEGLSCLE